MRINRNVAVGASVLIAGSVVAGLALAQPGERRRDQDRRRDQQQQRDPAAVQQPSFDEMMAEWAKYAEPGEQHKLLEPTIGTFTVNGKMWPEPGASEPIMMGGESVTRWVLGGRFAMTHYKSEFMGQPFEGMGMLGFDRYTQQYRSYWWDTFGTMTYETTGSVSPDGKTFVFHGSMLDPAQGGAVVRTRDIIRVVDNNTHTMEMHHTLPDGSWMKVMEITYTRK